MALALRLFLLLLLAVALPARAAQAAPLQARGADWDGDMAYPDALLDDSLDLLENAGGPPRWKNADTGHKKSLEAAKHLDQMLRDLERRRVMDQISQWKEAHPGGSSGSVPTSTPGRKAMPGAGTGTGEVLVKSHKNAQNPPSTPRVFCPQDVRKSCMIGTVVTLFTVPLSMVVCCVGFRWWKEKKDAAAAAPASWPRSHDSPSPPGSPETVGFGSSQTWPPQQQLSKKAEHQHSVPPPRPPSPAVKRKPPEIPPPPPLPSPPPWSS
ncbi:uncharacterized protein LOC128813780 [Vidua macroura]|uniref:uncharacterized protein LOC128813780 n=2 Tax=Vidua macroura TaxID=187451 RepID=UPI0023A8859B|nr:uncharacterized protein LOC128813780 [Vidua macroura]